MSATFPIGSNNDDITLGNGAGDTVKIDGNGSFSNNTISLGNGASGTDDSVGGILAPGIFSLLAMAPVTP